MTGNFWKAQAGHFSRAPKAYQLVAQTEAAILSLFPGKQETFDLLLRPRFERIIAERWFSGPTDDELPVN